MALLRAINLGSKNRLSMNALSGMFREAGCADVQTLIQSGNVVFRASPRCAKTLPGKIQDSIAKQFGLSAPVVLRSVEEWDQVVNGNPF